MASFEERLSAVRQTQAQPAPQSDFGARLSSVRETPQGVQATEATQAPEKVEATQVTDEEPWYEDMAEGVGASMLGKYYDIKDLVVGMDDEDVANLKNWEDDAAQSAWGSATKNLADMANVMSPGGVGTDKDFQKGAKYSGMTTYYGLKDLFSELDEGDREKLAKAKTDSDTFMGNVGQIGGELTQLAAPAGALTKTLQAAGWANKLGKVAPVITDALATAGLEATKLPEEGETRGDAALEGLTDSLTGSALAKTLSKVTRGVDITDEAKKILDKGGFLTAGKSAKSKGIQGLESVAEVTPFLAKGVKKAQAKAKSKWEDIVTTDAAPSGVKITGKGQDAVRQLKGAYDDAYTKAWSEADNVSNQARVNFVDSVEKSAQFLPPNEARKVINIAKDFKNVLTDINPAKIKAYDNRIRREISSTAYDKVELRDALKGMRETFRKGLPAETQTALREVDKDYAKYLVVKKATAQAAGDKGEFSPRQLINAVKSVGGETRTALGEAPLQDLATAGVQTVDRKTGGAPLEWFRRIAGAVPTPLPVEATSNLMIGQTPIQKAARRTIESDIIDELRKVMPTSGQWGGVLLDDELDEKEE